MFNIAVISTKEERENWLTESRQLVKNIISILNWKNQYGLNQMTRMFNIVSGHLKSNLVLQNSRLWQAIYYV